MCEICNAWALKKMILATRNVDGWSAKVADTRLDNRIRLQGNLEIDKVFGINNPIEAIALLKEHLNKYLELTYTRITKD